MSSRNPCHDTTCIILSPRFTMKTYRLMRKRIVARDILLRQIFLISCGKINKYSKRKRAKLLNKLLNRRVIRSRTSAGDFHHCGKIPIDYVSHMFCGTTLMLTMIRTTRRTLDHHSSPTLVLLDIGKLLRSFIYTTGSAFRAF